MIEIRAFFCRIVDFMVIFNINLRFLQVFMDTRWIQKNTKHIYSLLATADPNQDMSHHQLWFDEISICFVLISVKFSDTTSSNVAFLGEFFFFFFAGGGGTIYTRHQTKRKLIFFLYIFVSQKCKIKVWQGHDQKIWNNFYLSVFYQRHLKWNFSKLSS